MSGNAALYYGHNMLRRTFDNCTQWLPTEVFENAVGWDYAVYKFPFVPGFHVCRIYDDDTPQGSDDWEEILSTHKTLHEAMDVCKLLLANGGAHYE